MKLLVTVKRVIDPNVRVRLNLDRGCVETQHIKMVMNPFDEIALEAAIRLKEKQIASEIVVVTIGQDVCQETLRHGLALGADRALLIQTDDQLCSLNRAKILRAVVLQESPQLVLMGKQAIDDDNNQTPQMLAGLLNWPQLMFASKIDIQNDQISVTREIDQGLELMQAQLPAVVSVDLRLNEPRYATLPNIMKAKQKPLVIQPLAALGLNLQPHIQSQQVKNPSIRPSGVMVDSVSTLLDKLQHDMKVWS